MQQICKFNIGKDQREFQPRGTSDFPISIYGTRASEYAMGYLELHWHNDVQFTYVVEGACQFQVNQTAIELTEGMGLFINSGCRHMAQPITPDVSFIHIVFDASILSGYVGSTLDHKYVAPVVYNPRYAFAALHESVDWQQQALKQLKQICTCYDVEPPFYELDIWILLLSLWKILLTNITPLGHTSEQSSNPRLKQIISYLHTHYMERITLQELAEEVHLCRHECCKYFKRHMHCTIFEYLNDYRLSQSSKALLNDGEKSVSDIAFEYGFGSTSAFIENFRKKIGVTPGVYRRLAASKENQLKIL